MNATVQPALSSPRSLALKEITVRKIARIGLLLFSAGVNLSFAAAQPSSPPDAASAETSAGWVKHAGNPVLGGRYGTCFDISVLKEGGRYRMWVSWRPKASIALVESGTASTGRSRRSFWARARKAAGKTTSTARRS